MDFVTLVNTSPEHGKFLGELPHNIICKRTGVCLCAKRTVLTSGGKRKSLKTPETFTVCVGGRTRVPRMALGLKPVKQAIRMGWLVEVGSAPKQPDNVPKLQNPPISDAQAKRLSPKLASTPGEMQVPFAQAIAHAIAPEPKLTPAMKTAVAEATVALKEKTTGRRK